uniref:(northern house mosquito) hypothetical protein n=1 Tax=Culex pipiens TaxID=7175 RepID=A0A8D8L0K2_CULPI
MCTNTKSTAIYKNLNNILNSAQINPEHSATYRGLCPVFPGHGCDPGRGYGPDRADHDDPCCDPGHGPCRAWTTSSTTWTAMALPNPPCGSHPGWATHRYHCSSSRCCLPSLRLRS